jgi:hypothetical protein
VRNSHPDGEADPGSLSGLNTVIPGRPEAEPDPKGRAKGVEIHKHEVC